MPAIHHLIDCDGRALRSPFQSLRDALGMHAVEHALITHAVEKLGYVHVQEWPRGVIVSYRRLSTNSVALAGAIYLLADMAEKRVTFSLLDEPLANYFCRGRSKAIERLISEMRDLDGGMLQPPRALPDVASPDGATHHTESTKRNTI
jgi:hypothetical protein